MYMYQMLPIADRGVVADRPLKTMRLCLFAGDLVPGVDLAADL